MSETAATGLGGIIPPPSPVYNLSASSTFRLGARAEAMTAIESTSSPARATGRRPKESDSGLANTRETAQAPKVAVASSPLLRPMPQTPPQCPPAGEEASGPRSSSRGRLTGAP